MPLVLVQTFALPWVRRGVLGTLALVRANVTRLQFRIVADRIRRIHLIQVGLEAFLALQTREVTCRELVLGDAVLGNSARTDLAHVSP